MSLPKKNKKKALIFGVSGQDGSILSSQLLKQDYEVIGITRKKRDFYNHKKLLIAEKIKLIECDYSYESIELIIKNFKPEKIFNLSGESSVANSFENIYESFDSNVNISLRILECVKKFSSLSKVLLACSSECFKPLNGVVDELSELDPKSPYAASKACNYVMAKQYRENHSLFISNAIMFNHESSLRPQNFVISKVLNYVKEGDFSKKLSLGNIEINRDWGFAPEYCNAMNLILENKLPDYFCVCTGKTFKLMDMIDFIFSEKNLNWKEFVSTSKDLFRPSEHKSICGNPEKIRKKLNWMPKVYGRTLVRKLYNEELI